MRTASQHFPRIFECRKVMCSGKIWFVSYEKMPSSHVFRKLAIHVGILTLNFLPWNHVFRKSSFSGMVVHLGYRWAGVTRCVGLYHGKGACRYLRSAAQVIVRRLVVFVANSFFKVLPLRFATTTNSTFFRITFSPEIFRTCPNLSEPLRTFLNPSIDCFNGFIVSVPINLTFSLFC
jgi:hypothetical protein